ncbi:MAG: WecB/TagA/CpsF family glycosyltransferase [Treponematales bacterium]
MNSARIITFVNTFSYYKLVDSGCPVADIDCFFVDGSFQVRLHNIFHKDKINRASFDFSSLADDFFNYAVTRDLKTAIIAASDAEARAAVANLRNKYPRLRIPYFRNGYFTDEREKQDTADILKSNSIDAVILGMGTPAQEEFAVYLKNSGVRAYIFTCGGFITQTAKNIDYYSAIAKKGNLRWLQRAIEYKHVRRRLLFDYPKNLLRYSFDHIVLRVNSCSTSNKN